MKPQTLILGTALVLLAGLTARAEIKVTVDRNETGDPAFKFKNVPAPSKTDAATKATFAIVDGTRDENGGDLDKLHDGKLPTEEDQPLENFFFNAGTPGGRVSVDLGSALEIRQVNTYSWHPSTRGPQVYKLYASDGKADGFSAQPKQGKDPLDCGWKLITKVDTRPKAGESGGQYGVSISDTEGAIGKYQYLLFDMATTETDDEFGNTFYSEIDVVARDGATGAGVSSAPAKDAFVIRSSDGYCQISIDTSGAPDLKEWADTKLAPVLATWYPKIVAMLPSEGYSAPTNFSVFIRPGNGVAATGGGRVTANSTWLKRELNGEAVGALLHEEVHVIQRYGGRRNNPDAKRPPGWLVEGIPDYIRWFIYEPQSHGADAVFFRTRRNVKLNYDGLYRVSANFLDYVVENYGKDKGLITKVNAACRQGTYTDDLWKELTGKALPDLNEEWKAALQKQIAQPQSGS
jgi:Peptidase of plants and bacteria